jgi:hypothetical protein
MFAPQAVELATSKYCFFLAWVTITKRTTPETELIGCMTRQCRRSHFRTMCAVILGHHNDTYRVTLAKHNTAFSTYCDKFNMMGGECSTHGKDKKYLHFSRKYLKKNITCNTKVWIKIEY